MGTKGKDDIVLNLEVLRICKVLNLEELLHLMYTLLSQVNNLVLFIYDKVSRLLLLDSHKGIHLRVFRKVFSSLHLSCKDITGFVKLC